MNTPMMSKLSPRITKLIESGHIGKDDGPIVVCITGNGMKTQDPLVGKLPAPALIGPSLTDFDKLQAAIKT